MNDLKELLTDIIKEKYIADIIIEYVESLNGRDFEYEDKNYIYSEKHEDYHIKCRNYDICNMTFPIWWKNCKGKYLCTHCDIILTQFYENDSEEESDSDEGGVIIKI
jgi:hypothetical protein